MKKCLIFLAFAVLLSVSVQAKTLDEKKDELKKIYEAGGISKIEYEKAKEFLTKSKEETKTKKQKQSLSLSKKKSNSKKKNSKEDKKPILDEDIAKLEIYDKKVFQEDFLKYPSEIINFFGKNSSTPSRAKKAGGYMSKEFNRGEEGQQRFPGRMIKAMAMYEIFFIDSLRQNKKNLIRYKEKRNTKYLKKKIDEKKIRSLISMNEGREKMRTALGMSLDTPRAEAIKKFWFLGEFLDMGQALKNNDYDPKLEERKKLLNQYKQKISKLKKKIEEEEEKKVTN